jgi:hypothetical protein
VLTSYFAANRSSNPYRLAADPGPGIYEFTSGSYAEGSDADTIGFTGAGLGGLHYYVSFDISSITDFNLAHFTQKCGNDNLVGAVPEPATILLSGMGLLGMGVFLRRKYSAKAV